MDYLDKIVSSSVISQIFLICLCILLLKFVKDSVFNNNFYYYASKLDGPSSLPLIGSALHFMGSKKRVLDNIVAFTKKYKSPWKVWLGSLLLVVLTTPEDVEVVLNQRLDKSYGYQFSKPVIGEGLFTGAVPKWKRHRKVILTTFNLQILNSFVAIFAEHSRVLVKTLGQFEGKGCFDMFPIATQGSLGMICETAMGKSNSASEDNSYYVKKFARAMNLVFERLFSVWLHPNIIWRFTQSCKELDELSKELFEFVTQIVTEKKAEFRRIKEEGCDTSEDVKKKKKSFLDHLIEESENGESWPDEELIEEAATMVAAGSESVGSSVSYTLIMIGMHPDIQERVYNEILEIFGTSDRDATPEDLNEMVYLERVIKETLRLFPVTSVIGRYLPEDTTVRSVILPKGCTCIIGIMAIHRDPSIWDKPSEFRPDRFLPEEVAKRHPCSFLPFSSGPRNCIGFKYAMMAMKTIVSSVVRRYTISTDYKNVSDISFAPGVILKCAKGYQVALRKRN